MIPDVIEVQAALPLTANGKVNRKRLMSSRETRNTGEEHERIAAVQGPIRKRLAGLLKDREVGDDDDF